MERPLVKYGKTTAATTDKTVYDVPSGAEARITTMVIDNQEGSAGVITIKDGSTTVMTYSIAANTAKDIRFSDPMVFYDSIVFQQSHTFSSGVGLTVVGVEVVKS